MKRVLGLWAVVVALGVWGGVRAQRSASVSTKIQAGIAITVGCNLLLGLWLWFRAKPGSGDAMVAPTIALLSASMLLGILPRLLWPTAEGVQIAGSIASVIATTVLLIVQIRRWRGLRRSALPV